jgi:hypothetical protein
MSGHGGTQTQPSPPTNRRKTMNKAIKVTIDEVEEHQKNTGLPIMEAKRDLIRQWVDTELCAAIHAIENNEEEAIKNAVLLMLEIQRERIKK